MEDKDELELGRLYQEDYATQKEEVGPFYVNQDNVFEVIKKVRHMLMNDLFLAIINEPD